VMNNYPMFFKDFLTLEKHQSIEVVLSRDFQPSLPLDANLDLVICVPSMDKRPTIYYGALDIARRHEAKLALLNFETPNWFNAMSPVPRDASLWMQWDWISQYCDAIISSTEEGGRQARSYFTHAPDGVLFTVCPPSINSVVADAVPKKEKERRIFVPTRFSFAEHKGGQQIPDMITESWRGVALVVLGGGTPPKRFLRDLKKKARKYGVTYELLSNLSDHEKFTELKRACLTLYPSFFEGYGYPPIESLYCGTPCICFDLPVFRETCGDAVMTVPVGDWNAFRQQIDECLRGFNKGRRGDGSDLSAAVERLAKIDHYSQRVKCLFEDICFEEAASGQKIAALRKAADPLQYEPVRRKAECLGGSFRSVVGLARKLTKMLRHRMGVIRNRLRK
ncbi:MAG: glycosyltransferase, partial [Nitrospirales bacterium]|nr:glycosyltransferase [Nitrospirales bacterium]